MTDNPTNTPGTTGSTPQAGTEPDSKTMQTAIGVGADVLDRVQDILKGGQVRAVRIKLGDRTLREIPVEAAAFTAILIAVAAVVVSQLRVEIVRG